MKSKKYSVQNTKAFTLVELIVVIVILAILATIAFLSFSNQSSSARDSTRLSDVSNIVKGLMVFSTVGGTYPIPDKAINIMSGATTQIGYQGEAGANILPMIKFSTDGGKDPLDKVYYTYNTNLVRNKAQLLTFLENNSNVTFNPFSNTQDVFATDYTNRYTFEKGDQLGIILKKTIATTGDNSGSIIYTPIQDIPSIQTSGFTVTDTAVNSGMIAVLDNTTSGTGVTLNNLVGFTSPLNPVINNNTVTSGNQISSDTDLYTLSNSGLVNIFDNGGYYTSSWAANGCNKNNITVDSTTFVPGNLSSKSLSGNTIYKVPNGTYILNGSTANQGYIYFLGNCSALVGESANGVIFSANFSGGSNPENVGIIRLSAKNNVIINNIKIDGGKSLTYKFNAGIHLSGGSNNTLNNTTVYNTNQFGIYLYSTSNNMIMNTKNYDNSVHGIYVYSSSNSNTITNSQNYNTGNGIFIYSSINNTINNTQNYLTTTAGINLNISASGNTINNTNTYSGVIGIYVDTATNNVISNSNSYSNSNYGVYLGTNSSNNTLTNLLSYNNTQNGIYITGNSGNTINNAQVFNNGGGIKITGSYEAFNNIQTYNNNTHGISTSGVGNSNNLFNNIASYNNGSQSDGFNFDYLNSSYLNNLYSYDHAYNGDNNGILLKNSSGNKYYGNLKLLANGYAYSGTTLADTQITQGNDAIFGFGSGALITTGTYNCTLQTDPNILAPTSLCPFRGKRPATTIPVTSFIYGAGLPNQTRPLKWNGTIFEYYGIDGTDYNTGKKIGEK